ncbi:MAG TPA: transposase [Verrucomicrobiae bacterium]|nr:transposase [Verrucomicrobiae bacterium]
MPRQLRIEYPGAIYHVMNRGDRREPVFLDDADNECFLKTLGEACLKTDWQIHAYCLMGNHFHLVLETPAANLVAGMRWFLGTYTARFNRRHKFFGHLFSGRYKSLIVDGSGNGYLRTVCDYVHLNPARARLVSPAKPLGGYRWSSWPEYLKAPSRRPLWLRTDRLLGAYHIPKDSPAGRAELENDLERRRAHEDDGNFKGIRRGWCLGSETFRAELVAAAETLAGEHHSDLRSPEMTEEKACRLLQAELEQLNCTRAELARWPKSDARKIRIARRLRQETAVTLKWLAEELLMGNITHVANCLRRKEKKRNDAKRSN